MAAKDILSVDDIRVLIEEAYDADYYNALYRQINIAFGDTLAKRDDSTYATKGEFPDFPDVVVKNLKAGQSRKILNAALIHLAKAMATQPEPRWTQVDKWLNEVRRQCYLFRAQGRGYGDGQWQNQNAIAFTYGDALGAGFLQYEFKTNPSTGKQYVHKRASSTLHTLWDPHEQDPSRATYICFVRYLRPESARARWGADKVDQYIETYGGSGTKDLFKAIRIFQFFSLPMAGKKATHCVIAKSHKSGAVLEHEESPFPDCLPCVSYVDVLFPGMRRPIGRVVRQLASQEIINHLEQRMVAGLTKHDVDVIDTAYFDDKDIAAWEQGKKRTLKTKLPMTPGHKAFERHEGTKFDQATLLALNYFEQAFNTDSSTTEYDQSKSPDKDRTAFEAGLIQGQTQPTQGWSIKQTLEFYQRDVMTFSKLFAMYDRDPLVVDIFGYNITVNESPQNLADIFFEEPSLVEIDEASITVGAGDAKRARRLAELEKLLSMNLVGQSVDPIWFTEQVLRALNCDPREAMGAGSAAMQSQTAPESGAMAQNGLPEQPAIE